MPSTSVVQNMEVTLLIGFGLEQFSLFAAMSHESGRVKIVKASQDARSGTSKKSHFVF